MLNTSASLVYSPLDVRGLSLGRQAVALVAGVCVLTASSYVQVPMVPVPLTMQTLAVTVIGALYGRRLGALTIIAWLAAAAAGAPVMAGDHIADFVGPTAGYLAAFPIVGALCGFLAERSWNGRNLWLAGASMLIGNLLCLALGGAWLSVLIGADKAIAAGVTPFLLGAALKSALGAVVMKGLWIARKRGEA